MLRKFLIMGAAVAVMAMAAVTGFGARSADAAAVADTGGPYAGIVGVPIQFSAANSVGAVTYAWDFGDGTTDSTIAPMHTYSTAGVFTVTLTVTDPFGTVTVATTTATVSPTSGTTVIPTTTAVFSAPQCPFGAVVQDNMFFCVGAPLSGVSPFVTTPGITTQFVTTPSGAVVPVQVVTNSSVVTTPLVCPFFSATLQSCLVPATGGNVQNSIRGG